MISYLMCAIVLISTLIGYIRAEDLIQDAAVYPGPRKTKLKLQFSKVGDFSDIQTIAEEKGFLGTGLFCVIRGAFILYNQPFYDAKYIGEITIAAGAKTCTDGSAIGSAQPIGPIGEPKVNSITFFTRPNFASTAYPVQDSVTYSYFSSVSSTLKSIITIGTTPWTLKTAHGMTICIRPTPSDASLDPSDICLLPNLVPANLTQSGINIMQVVKGCEDLPSAQITVNITTCQHWVEAPEKTANSVPEKPGWRNLQGGFNATDCRDYKVVEFKNFLYFFQTRLTKHFNDENIFDFPGATFQKWKLDMFDVIWSVAKQSVPHQFMPLQYMDLIREYFVSDLASGWRRHVNFSVHETTGHHDDMEMNYLTEIDYQYLLESTRQCLALVNETDRDEYWEAWINTENVDASVNQSLAYSNANNIIIDMAWLVFNMVFGICSKKLEFRDNAFALYPHFVCGTYLGPTGKEWLNTSQTYMLEHLLGGSMLSQYNRLAIWTQMALGKAQYEYPFMRCMEQVGPATITLYNKPSYEGMNTTVIVDETKCQDTKDIGSQNWEGQLQSIKNNFTCIVLYQKPSCSGYHQILSGRIQGVGRLYKHLHMSTGSIKQCDKLDRNRKDLIELTDLRNATHTLYVTNECTEVKFGYIIRIEPYGNCVAFYMSKDCTAKDDDFVGRYTEQRDIPKKQAICPNYYRTC